MVLPIEALTWLQSWAARRAIGASSMRGGAGGGVVEAARHYLSGDLKLGAFGTPRQERFRMVLDQATAGLLRALPKSDRHWGLARKGLNIFLRECLYTVYLRRAYSLHLAERFFEVPLDSITGKALQGSSPDSTPSWPGVRKLTKADSDSYQEAAKAMAARNHVARVHLDAYLWGLRTKG